MGIPLRLLIFYCTKIGQIAAAPKVQKSNYFLSNCAYNSGYFLTIKCLYYIVFLTPENQKKGRWVNPQSPPQVDFSLKSRLIKSLFLRDF